MTMDEIVQSVNNAGFADAAAFTKALTLANLVLQRQGLDYVLRVKAAALVVADQAANQEMGEIQAQQAILDAQIVALVGND